MGNLETMGIGSALLQQALGGPPPTAEISLRFFSAYEHPVELTDLLGIEPTACYAPHSTHRNEDGTEINFRQGSWMWVIKGGPDASIPDGIHYMLSRLPEDPHLWRRLTTKYEADIFCEFGAPARSRSLELPVATMQGLIQRNLRLSLALAPAL